MRASLSASGANTIQSVTLFRNGPDKTDNELVYLNQHTSR
jgi:hypothetical protein